MALLVVTALFLVQFGRTLGYGLVWDDQILSGPFFGQPLGKLLLGTQQEQLDTVMLETRGFKIPFDSYRPIASLSYWCDLGLWGLRAAAFHAHNVLLGLLNVFLAFHVARRLFRAAPWVALACAAMFALHPLQVEPVAYVAARSDLLAGTFTLLCALCAAASADADAQAARRRWLMAALSGACLVASLLTKESSLGLPLGLLAIGLVQGRVRSFGRAALVQLGGVAAWLAARTMLLRSGDAVQGDSPLRMVLSVPAILGGYLEGFFLPTDLSIERQFHTATVWSCLAGGVLAMGLLLAARRRQGPDGWAAQAAAGLLWAGALLATAPFGVFSTNVLSDRYAYVAILGMTIACAAPLQDLRRARPALKPILMGVAGVWSLGLALVAILQVPTWRDNGTLYAHALRTQPDSSMASYRVGYLHARNRQWELALPHFARAVELDPGNYVALNNQGVTLLNLRRWDDAIAALERASAVTGNINYRALYNIGLAHEGAGRRAFAASARVNHAYEQARRALHDRCPAGQPAEPF